MVVDDDDEMEMVIFIGIYYGQGNQIVNHCQFQEFLRHIEAYCDDIPYFLNL